MMAVDFRTNRVKNCIIGWANFAFSPLRKYRLSLQTWLKLRLQCHTLVFSHVRLLHDWSYIRTRPRKIRHKRFGKSIFTFLWYCCVMSYSVISTFEGHILALVKLKLHKRSWSMFLKYNDLIDIIFKIN